MTICKPKKRSPTAFAAMGERFFSGSAACILGVLAFSAAAASIWTADTASAPLSCFAQTPTGKAYDKGSHCDDQNIRHNHPPYMLLLKA